ncbi:uncharacterized protein B0H64DRAFT_224063 [Chaetomium fimeti]|uniref:Uncharacterized protein n=1 Tax=Chaetomium fimeti TaxID=1854472 RepID=A0AAE0HAX8_9PEZI|nr:hypothetical protein B0H64DRAFT_224063 [Chaetomium fimeti]
MRHCSRVRMGLELPCPINLSEVLYMFHPDTMPSIDAISRPVSPKTIPHHDCSTEGARLRPPLRLSTTMPPAKPRPSSFCQPASPASTYMKAVQALDPPPAGRPSPRALLSPPRPTEARDTGNPAVPPLRGRRSPPHSRGRLPLTGVKTVQERSLARPSQDRGKHTTRAAPPPPPRRDPYRAAEQRPLAARPPAPTNRPTSHHLLPHHRLLPFHTRLLPRRRLLPYNHLPPFPHPHPHHHSLPSHDDNLPPHHPPSLPLPPLNPPPKPDPCRPDRSNPLPQPLPRGADPRHTRHRRHHRLFFV